MAGGDVAATSSLDTLQPLVVMLSLGLLPLKVTRCCSQVLLGKGGETSRVTNGAHLSVDSLELGWGYGIMTISNPIRLRKYK